VNDTDGMHISLDSSMEPGTWDQTLAAIEVGTPMKVVPVSMAVRPLDVPTLIDITQACTVIATS
jgi:hypothetical protein